MDEGTGLLTDVAGVIFAKDDALVSRAPSVLEADVDDLRRRPLLPVLASLEGRSDLVVQPTQRNRHPVRDVVADGLAAGVCCKHDEVEEELLVFVAQEGLIPFARDRVVDAAVNYPRVGPEVRRELLGALPHRRTATPSGGRCAGRPARESVLEGGRHARDVDAGTLLQARGRAQQRQELLLRPLLQLADGCCFACVQQGDDGGPTVTVELAHTDGREHWRNQGRGHDVVAGTPRWCRREPARHGSRMTGSASEGRSLEGGEAASDFLPATRLNDI